MTRRNQIILPTATLHWDIGETGSKTVDVPIPDRAPGDGGASLVFYSTDADGVEIVVALSNVIQVGVEAVEHGLMLDTSEVLNAYGTNTLPKLDLYSSRKCVVARGFPNGDHGLITAWPSAGAAAAFSVNVQVRRA